MRTIRLDDFNAILPQCLVIHCRPNNEPSWDIAGIEIYADSACTRLLADDIQIGMLDPSAQMSIYAALNAHQHEIDQERFAARVRAEHGVGSFT